MPKVVRSVVRSTLLKNVRFKNGCAVSSIGKVNLLFGFNNRLDNNWVKYSTSLYKFLETIYEKSMNKEIQFPSWLITTRTILTAKNQFSSEAKNYRPIACQNTLYKLHTGIIASFIGDHGIENNIITQEQSGAKKGSWGCQGQLMINKAVLEDAKKNRKNIFLYIN